MFKLVISDDEGKTTVVPLVRDEITIGRKEGNTIRLTERNVSRRHARLFKANGAFTIEDLSSYNGIKVNGRKIGEPASLKAGDQVTIGDYLLALQVDAAETRTEPTTPMAQPEPEAPTTMLAAPAPEPVPPARLVMLSPPAPGAEFALAKPHVRFGRAEDLDAWVNHRSISREHAEIVHEGDTYRIVDLGSANGLRVNGQDTRDAVLEPGDVIEMGQVRFRFVGRGEAYVFDADRTIQMEAVPSGGSRAPIFAAVGIIVVAVVIGGVIAMGGDDDEEPIATVLSEEPAPASAVPEVSPEPAQAAMPLAADAEAFREALTNCRNAYEDQRFDEAVRFAEQALGLAAGNDQAEECKSNAETGQQEEAKYQSALAHYRNREYDEAYADLAELDANSPYLREDEALRIYDKWAYETIVRADRVLQRDPQRASDMVQPVLDLGDRLSTERRGDAQEIRRAAARAGRTVAVATTRRQPRSTHVQRATEEPEVRPTQERNPPPQQRCDPAAPTYSRCIIETYERSARTPREFQMLIEAYRNVGNMPAALRHMRTYVQRWPDDRQSRQYQQILNAHSQ